MAKMKNAPAVFNSPFELGIRMVYVLSGLYPRGADLQKLVVLDFLVIYSEDFDGPISLHTPVPQRNVEFLSRRDLIRAGLHLMSTKGLVDVQLSDEGVTYYAGENSRSLVGSIGTSYAVRLAERCEWVAEKYGNSNADSLAGLLAGLDRRWDAELDLLS